MTQDLSQLSFFKENTKKESTATPTAKKSSFTPPTLENGLSKGLISDHAMLWLRMLSKQSQANPLKYFTHQISEIQFKRTEYDQSTAVRHSILHSCTKI